MGYDAKIGRRTMYLLITSYCSLLGFLFHFAYSLGLWNNILIRTSTTSPYGHCFRNTVANILRSGSPYVGIMLNFLM